MKFLRRGRRSTKQQQQLVLPKASAAAVDGKTLNHVLSEDAVRGDDSVPESREPAPTILRLKKEGLFRKVGRVRKGMMKRQKERQDALEEASCRTGMSRGSIRPRGSSIPSSLPRSSRFAQRAELKRQKQRQALESVLKNHPKGEMLVSALKKKTKYTNPSTMSQQQQKRRSTGEVKKEDGPVSVLLSRTEDMCTASIPCRATAEDREERDQPDDSSHNESDEEDSSEEEVEEVFSSDTYDTRDTSVQHILSIDTYETGDSRDVSYVLSEETQETRDMSVIEEIISNVKKRRQVNDNGDWDESKSKESHQPEHQEAVVQSVASCEQPSLASERSPPPASCHSSVASEAARSWAGGQSTVAETIDTGVLGQACVATETVTTPTGGQQSTVVETVDTVDTDTRDHSSVASPETRSSRETKSAAEPQDDDSTSYSVHSHSSRFRFRPRKPQKPKCLWNACMTGDIEFVKKAVQDDPSSVNVKQRGRTPLFYATIRSHHDIMRILLEAGALDEDKSIYAAAMDEESRQLLLEYERLSFAKRVDAFKDSIKSMTNCECVDTCDVGKDEFEEECDDSVVQVHQQDDQGDENVYVEVELHEEQETVEEEEDETSVKAPPVRWNEEVEMITYPVNQDEALSSAVQSLLEDDDSDWDKGSKCSNGDSLTSGTSSAWGTEASDASSEAGPGFFVGVFRGTGRSAGRNSFGGYLERYGEQCDKIFDTVQNIALEICMGVVARK